ncbi:MAG: potassium transporter TrkG, partial [Calditrichota bacterium]
LLFTAGMMALSIMVALAYEDGDALYLVTSALITAAGGGILFYVGRRRRDISLRDGFAVVTIGWLMMAFFGALPFYLSGAMPDFADAFFESMSGFTTTGASILGPHNPIESLPHGILFWRSLTHWIGGMGIILLSLAILPLLGVGGMQLYRAEVPGPTKDKLTPRIRDTAEILWGVYVLFSLLETALLWWGGMNLFDAACHTFGTMATGGFSTRSDSVGAYQNPILEYIIIIFMFIAGTNFTLHYYLFKGRVAQYWTSREFRLYLAVAVGFTAVIFVILLFHNQVSGWEQGFRQALFHVVSILTTTGYGAADWEVWGGLVQVLMVTLMLFGGMAGSTGGGIKVVRAQIMFRQISLELRRLIHPQAILPLRIGERLVDDGIVRNVLSFILVYLLILLIATAALSSSGMDLVTSFGASLACLSNIGPGLGEVGATDHYGWMPAGSKWLLSFIMMLGRLEVFTVLILFSHNFWRK